MGKYIRVRVYFKDELLQDTSFKPAEVVLGRSSDCQLILDNAGVSRHHAQLRLDQTQLTVLDLKSGNGTFLNGQQIEESPITATDTLVIGKFTLKVDTTDTPPTSATTSESAISSDVNQTVSLRPDERQQILEGTTKRQPTPAVTTPSHASSDEGESHTSPWMMFVAGLATGIVLCAVVGGLL